MIPIAVQEKISTKFSEDFSAALNKLKGKKIKKFIVDENSAEIKLFFDGGIILKAFHKTDCCESVDIIDFELPVNNPEEMTGAIFLEVEIARKDEQNVPNSIIQQVSKEFVLDSETWSFLKIYTSKGICDFWWRGISNGYYTETPSLIIDKADEFNYDIIDSYWQL